MSEQIKFGDRLFLRGESVFFDNGENDARIEPRNGTLVIRGNLVVEGNTTTVNSVQTVFADPYITLNSDHTGPATQDVGIEINRGDDPTVRLSWDEENDLWSFEDKDIYTTGNVSANIVLASLSGNVVSEYGVVMINSTGNGLVDIRAGNIDNTVIGATTPAAGYFTYIVGDGTDIVNVLTNYTTDDLVEGTTNLYYTNERVDDRFNSLFNSGYSLNSTYNDGLGSYTINFEAQNVGTGAHIYDNSNISLASFRTITTGNILNGGNSDLTVSVVGDEIRIDTTTKINQLAFNSYTGNGSTSIYTLPYAVASDWHILVYIDGVVQEPGDAYTVSNFTLTLSSPLALNSVMNVLRLAMNATTTTVVNADTLAGQLPSYYLNYNNLSNIPATIMKTDVNNSVSGNITPSSTNSYSLGNATNSWSNIYSSQQQLNESSVAERFLTDAVYDEGTVVIFGGTNEITVTVTENDTRVAGVIVNNPATLMNAQAGNSTTHPAVALSGRALCKVYGTVNKGDLLVSSTYAGYAIATTTPVIGSVIGKAITSNASGFGTVEISVGMM